MTLYVDTSALLKRYVVEHDSESAEELLLSDSVLVTSRLTGWPMCDTGFGVDNQCDDDASAKRISSIRSDTSLRPLCLAAAAPNWRRGPRLPSIASLVVGSCEVVG